MALVILAGNVLGLATADPVLHFTLSSSFMETQKSPLHHSKLKTPLGNHWLILSFVCEVEAELFHRALSLITGLNVPPVCLSWAVTPSATPLIYSEKEVLETEGREYNTDRSFITDRDE